MRNVLIILLTALIVVAGAFLPEILMKNQALPELDVDYHQISISAESSSDYAWRMERIGERYFGEGDRLVTTFISSVTPTEEEPDANRPFIDELTRLAENGAVPQSLLDLVADNENYYINYNYIFDSDAVSGFRIAEYVVSTKYWSVGMTMDVESGKLARITTTGTAQTKNEGSWYDILRGYALYLGLSPNAIAEHPDPNPGGVRGYYESCTADKWTGQLSDSPAWLELRILKETETTSLVVYNGGK